MRVYLIRHSMTKGNKEKRYIGTTDESLCLEGIQLLEERNGRISLTEYGIDISNYVLAQFLED